MSLYYSNILAITSAPSKTGLCPKTGESAVSVGFTLYSNTKKESAHYSQAYYSTVEQNHGSMLFCCAAFVIRKGMFMQVNLF